MMPVPEDEFRDLMASALALMTPRQRRRFWLRKKMRDAAYAVRRFVPGYRSVSLMVWRVKRQGSLRALWEPPFDIYRQDRDAYDRHLRWHHWGVLREDGGYRGYTPTKRTEVYETPRQAWLVLEGYLFGSQLRQCEP
jgi:hypothetical protein